MNGVCSERMEPLEQAGEIVDTMLGYLGFVVHVETEMAQEGPTVQIFTEESDLLVGRNGERLDDIQYLVNRILSTKDERAPRVRVDVAHYRAMREDELVQRVRELAEKVKATGKPVRLQPMNSYNRRIVHNAFIDDPDIESWSPEDKSRVKRITIRLKGTGL